MGQHQALFDYGTSDFIAPNWRALLQAKLADVLQALDLRWAAAALFATCSLVSPFSYNQNYFFPYAHAAILAMLFFLGLLAFLSAYLFRRHSAPLLAAALACAFAASWTKIEYAAFTTLVLLFAFAVHRIPRRWLVAYVATALASVGFVSWYFRDAPPSRHWLFGNVIPDVASAFVNYRYAPNRQPADAEARLRGWLPSDADVRVAGNAPPARVAMNNPLVERLQCLGQLAVEPKQAWTPVAEFSAEGLDAVNFGPGAGRYAHQRDEQVEIGQIVRAYDLLQRFLLAD